MYIFIYIYICIPYGSPKLGDLVGSHSVSLCAWGAEHMTNTHIHIYIHAHYTSIKYFICVSHSHRFCGGIDVGIFGAHAR